MEISYCPICGQDRPFVRKVTGYSLVPFLFVALPLILFWFNRAISDNQLIIGLTIWGSLLFYIHGKSCKVCGNKKTDVQPVDKGTVGMRKCPFCSEIIKTEAIRCPHCGSIAK